MLNDKKSTWTSLHKDKCPFICEISEADSAKFIKIWSLGGSQY